MSEPIAITTATAAGIAVGLTGTFLGISYDVLLAGFGAGIVVVAMSEGISPWRAVGKVLIALITAAFFSDFLAIVISGYTNLDSQYFRMPVAFTVGFLAQATILPWLQSSGKWLLDKIKKVLGQKIDEVAK